MRYDATRVLLERNAFEKIIIDLQAQLATLAAERDALAATLQAIRELCQRHNHAGVNVGCHELAGKVLAIIEGNTSR